MRHVIVLRAVFCALIALSIVTFTSPGTAAWPGGLNDRQGAKLNSLGVRVALPSYIPAGYTLEEVLVTPCTRPTRRTSCAWGPDYIVRYHNGSAWFSFEETAGDLAETKLTYKTFVKTKIFGAVPLRFGAGGDGVGMTPSAADLHSVQREVYSDWIGRGPYYHLIGERIAPDVMVKILGSIDWVQHS